MDIIIRTIPHSQQRYNTAGDWWFEEAGTQGGQNLHIRVSDTGDWRYDACVAAHELVEALLCRADGITQERVDAFDLSYKGEGEPGDDPNSPYQRKHCFATAVERMLIAAMNMTWCGYEVTTVQIGEANG